MPTVDNVANSPIHNNPFSLSPEILFSVTTYKLNKTVANLKEIIDAYTVYGKLTGCGNLVPFCQAAHETGWFTSEKWLKNNNPAGIGATNDGAMGNVWATKEEGILAQYAHLIAYAIPEKNWTPTQQNIVKFSPRLSILQKNNLCGIAPKWVNLNGRWAVPGKTYAQAIATIALRYF
jgi:N-acetylmuramoyl-L-alanine amidase